MQSALVRRQVRGIEILKLKGKFLERGIQYGTFLKDLIPHGALPVLAKKPKP